MKLSPWNWTDSRGRGAQAAPGAFSWPKYSPSDRAAGARSGLAILELGLEQAQPGGQVLVMGDRAEMLEQEDQRLVGGQSRFGREPVQHAIGVIRQRDRKAAGQA
ncbi:hypothetical protein SDC9_21298 [bioreactor metagenome]|uniref:Uncharacterized protein n=1 Tax=bioreactor metagenome TaxID=1076179 RepID=A0A644U945_9ZZZZ